MPVKRTAVLLVAVTAFLPAQTALPGSPAFEVVSIKPDPLPQGTVVSRIRTYSGPPPVRATGNRFAERRATLESLIMEAYGINADQILRLPAWAKGDDSLTEYYNVDARANGNEPPAENQLRLMLQSLLADRFQLRIHRETRDLAVYALRTDKEAPKLREITEEEFLAHPGASAPSVAGPSVVKSKIAILMMQLSPFFDLPVVNRTGLTGSSYEYADLNWSELRAERQIDPLAAQSAVSAAVREKLGLKLEAMRVPTAVIVVDRAEKPSPN